MSDNLDRIKTTVKLLEKRRYEMPCKITDLWVKQGDYTYDESCTYAYENKENHGFTKFGDNQVWGGSDRHFWFLTKIKVPYAYQDKKIVVQLHTGATDIWNTDNPQIMVYKNQELVGAMDMNHYRMTIEEEGCQDEEIKLVFYAYSNSVKQNNFFELEMAVINPTIEQLYYDMLVPYEAILECREDEMHRNHMIEILNQAVNILDLRDVQDAMFLKTAYKCIEYLQDACYTHQNSIDAQASDVLVHSIGHTHIDVAWKWPIKQTRQKVVRSFSNVIRLMETYPEYKFMSSQPQLYQYVKEDAPKLYAKIKEKIKENRWEVEGGMWLEADCNLASGESLIRHIYYGKKFFDEEFGVKEQKVLWLPDVFGYCTALPQIMKKSGVEYFMTTKLGWNEYNKMPHDLFLWQGNDGSEVLTYFITTIGHITYPELVQNKMHNTTYNGLQNPSQIKGTWQRFQDKTISREVLTCYGHGDGGGGPTEEMLEQDKRLKYGLAGCPRTKQTFVRDYFERLETLVDNKTLPKWCGELYLETHRGTYTSMAKNKKYNRKAEILMNDIELLDAFNSGLYHTDLKFQTLMDSLWKNILLNQFHDILPGSSIKEVYEETDKDYKKIFDVGEGLKKEMMKHLLDVKKQSQCVEAFGIVNNLGFERQALIKLDTTGKIPKGCAYQVAHDGTYIALTPLLPSKSLTVLEVDQNVNLFETKNETVATGIEQAKTGLIFETPYYNICINEKGEFSRIYDKKEQRETIEQEATMNQLVVYEDRPASFDAWNIDACYTEKSWTVDQLLEMQVIENGPLRATVCIRRQFMQSAICQNIHFYHHSPRIDIETTIDWQQHQLLLKALFNTDIFANKATYDVQFGQVERTNHNNTSWDAAQFEVCAHKWVDLSEATYGVSVLNDCKYGHNVLENQIQLTLIKSGVFPNPDADIGKHEFVYSILPHQGNHRTGGVIEQAHDLNQDVIVQYSESTVPGQWSLIHVEASNIMIETVKKAYEGLGIVIRLYENHGGKTQTYIHLPDLNAEQVWVCDMMENPLYPLEQSKDGYLIVFKPYEIITLKIL